ncbi:MAG TPA: hypothetical protein PKA31_03895 [Candidatus Moranbacteria bacterium]|nr:hypothetical protein [Candidatus Moranbacteria bacterium]
MTPVQTWGEAVTMSLLDLWGRFVGFVPALVGAILVLAIGFLIASLVGKVVSRAVGITRLDQAIDRMRLARHMRESGMEISAAGFFGELVRWFLVLVFLMAATDILGLDQVTDFLNSIILYLPNVVVATVILAIALLLANFVYSVVRSSTHAAGIMSATLLATISKWAIFVFGLLAALIQLGIAASLVNTIFIGLVAAISLATGLAFGLGGRDEAANILRKLREEIAVRK